MEVTPTKIRPKYDSNTCEGVRSFLLSEFGNIIASVLFSKSLRIRCPSFQGYVPLNPNVKVKCFKGTLNSTYNIFHGLNV